MCGNPLQFIGDAISGAVGAVGDVVGAIGDGLSDVASSDLGKVAIVAGTAYVTGGATLGADGVAAVTTAEIGAASAASGAAVLVPMETTVLTGWGPVTEVIAGSAAPVASAITGAEVLSGIKAAGTLAADGLGVVGKVAGGLNALSLVAGKPSVSTAPISGVKSVVPDYGVLPSQGGSTAQNTQDAVAAAPVAAGAVGAVKTNDSTLTMIASGLTIAAIVYQFSKEK